MACKSLVDRPHIYHTSYNCLKTHEQSLMGADFCVNFCDMFVGQKINLPFLCFVQKKPT